MLCIIQHIFFFFFFSIRVFFHRHWQLTGQQGKGGDLFLFHSTTSTRSRTFRHLCATLHVRWLSPRTLHSNVPRTSSKELIWPSWWCSNLKGFQLPRIFRDCPEIKHHLLKSRNTINLSRIKAFSSTLEKIPKFLFFHSTKLFVYKLTSSSTSSSTIFKCFKSQRWCLLKNSSSSVLLYLDNLIPRP